MGDSKHRGRSFLGIIVVLASMMYSLVSDTYELHPNDKKIFNGFRSGS